MFMVRDVLTKGPDSDEVFVSIPAEIGWIEVRSVGRQFATGADAKLKLVGPDGLPAPGLPAFGTGRR
jgi:hypothetical protein